MGNLFQSEPEKVLENKYIHHGEEKAGLCSETPIGRSIQVLQKADSFQVLCVVNFSGPHMDLFSY